jgi:hypothetical protein
MVVPLKLSLYPGARENSGLGSVRYLRSQRCGYSELSGQPGGWLSQRILLEFCVKQLTYPPTLLLNILELSSVLEDLEYSSRSVPIKLLPFAGALFFAKDPCGCISNPYNEPCHCPTDISAPWLVRNDPS